RVRQPASSVARCRAGAARWRADDVSFPISFVPFSSVRLPLTVYRAAEPVACFGIAFDTCADGSAEDCEGRTQAPLQRVVVRVAQELRQLIAHDLMRGMRGRGDAIAARCLLARAVASTEEAQAESKHRRPVREQHGGR